MCVCVYHVQNTRFTHITLQPSSTFSLFTFPVFLTAHPMSRILFELADFFIWETLQIIFLYFKNFHPSPSRYYWIHRRPCVRHPVISSQHNPQFPEHYYIFTFTEIVLSQLMRQHCFMAVVTPWPIDCTTDVTVQVQNLHNSEATVRSRYILIWLT